MTKQGLTLQEVNNILSYSGNTTHYEKDNGISNTGVELIYDSEFTKFYILNKSDGTKTMVLAFKASETKEEDRWFMWTMGKKQAIEMTAAFPHIYWKLVEKHNKEVRNK